MEYKIREVTKDDGQNIVDLLKTIDAESTRFLFEPGERPTTEKRIKEITTLDHVTIFLAEFEDELLGYLLVFRGEFKRRQHAIDIVIGVKQQHTGMGIGTALLTAIEEWGKNNGIHRIHLTVEVDNKGAYALYKKFGFEDEGLSRHTRFVDGEYKDEYVMGKLI